jgi:hypothetical protein
MITSKYSNPLDAFICHGIKEISTFTYVLLVNTEGKCVIERISDDESSVMFAKMTDPVEGTSFLTRAAAIDAFWTDPVAGKSYSYLFQC